MNQQGIIERAQLLLTQHRPDEARKLLTDYLAQYPEDFDAKLIYGYALLQSDESKDAYELSTELLSERPDSIQAIVLASEVDLGEERYERALSRGEHLIELAPYLPTGYQIIARSYLGQRNIDKSRIFIDKALELDPEDIDALNFKIMIDGMDGKSDTDDTLDTALRLDPNNPYSIANHGMQLLRKGNVRESLERFKEALALDPENYIAKTGMSEALKSRFWPYRMFFKLGEKMSRLSELGAWKVVIGGYLLVRVLRGIAKNNEAIAPFIFPIIIALVALFYLSWVFSPLMNVYLLTNPYGKYLLDEDDQKMAKYSAASLGLAILCAIGYFAFGIERLGLGGFFFFGMLIPLGSFLNVQNPSKRKSIIIFVVGMLVVGVLGILLNQVILVGIGLLCIFIYQWVFNAIMLNEHSRVYD